MSDNRDLVRSQFGANAPAYGMSSVHARGPSLERLIELLQPRPEWEVLDIATGGGHTALAFAPHVRRVVASDLTTAMLEVAAGIGRERNLTNLEFEVADATALRFADHRFDVVVCRIAAHHFHDVESFLAESARVLRPGGWFALVDNLVPADPAAAVWVNDFERRRDPSHVRCLGMTEWMEAIARHGMALSHRESTPKRFDFDEWCDRMRVPAPVKAQLRADIASAPPAVLDYFKPTIIGASIGFEIEEGLLLARRQ